MSYENLRRTRTFSWKQTRLDFSFLVEMNSTSPVGDRSHWASTAHRQANRQIVFSDKCHGNQARELALVINSANDLYSISLIMKSIYELK